MYLSTMRRVRKLCSMTASIAGTILFRFVRWSVDQSTIGLEVQVIKFGHIVWSELQMKLMNIHGVSLIHRYVLWIPT